MAVAFLKHPEVKLSFKIYCHLSFPVHNHQNSDHQNSDGGLVDNKFTCVQIECFTLVKTSTWRFQCVLCVPKWNILQNLFPFTEVKHTQPASYTEGGRSRYPVTKCTTKYQYRWLYLKYHTVQNQNLLVVRGTGTRGLMRGMATLPQGNQELLVVRDKVGRPQVSLG